jgi:hypothetical protein
MIDRQDGGVCRRVDVHTRASSGLDACPWAIEPAVAKHDALQVTSAEYGLFESDHPVRVGVDRIALAVRFGARSVDPCDALGDHAARPRRPRGEHEVRRSLRPQSCVAGQRLSDTVGGEAVRQIG